MSKETAKPQPNPSGDSQIKDSKAAITVLTDEEVNQVSGGKHLAGVKYEDITVACPTNTTSRP